MDPSKSAPQCIFNMTRAGIPRALARGRNASNRIISQKPLDFPLLDRTLTVGDELEQTYVGSDKAYLLSRNVAELLNEEIHKVFTVKERMDDFTLPYEGYVFYPILKKSNLCNIPDNVTWDWLDVIQKFLEIMDKYPQAVRDEDNMLPCIKERVKDILKKRAQRCYEELYRSFYEG